MDKRAAPHPCVKSSNTVQWSRRIKQFVADPALELGLPVDIALRMLVRYSMHLVGDRLYKGCHDFISELESYRGIYPKVTTDNALQTTRGAQE